MKKMPKGVYERIQDDEDYKDRDWLFDQYWNLKKTQKEIGEGCGVTRETIIYWMKKLNVPRRSNSDSKKLFYIKKRYEEGRWRQGNIRRKRTPSPYEDFGIYKYEEIIDEGEYINNLFRELIDIKKDKK